LLTKKNNTGFTLIEVLLAIFIFAVVISLIFTAYTGAIRIMNETDSQAGVQRMASITLERMTEDLESLSLSAWIKPGGTSENVLSGRFLGENLEVEGRSADRIRFLSRAGISFGNSVTGGGMAEISYYLTQEGDEGDFILYRSETPALEPSPEKETGGLELCRGLRAIEISYMNGNSEVSEEWDSDAAETKNQLPRLVTLTLSFRDPSGDEEAVYSFRTSVLLPLWREQNEKTP